MGRDSLQGGVGLRAKKRILLGEREGESTVEKKWLKIRTIQGKYTGKSHRKKKWPKNDLRT